MTANPTPLPPEGVTLKPCPFCGSINIEPKGWKSFTASGPACDDCGASAGSVSDNHADNVAAWNTRIAATSAAEGDAMRETEPVEALRSAMSGDVGKLRERLLKSVEILANTSMDLSLEEWGMVSQPFHEAAEAFVGSPRHSRCFEIEGTVMPNPDDTAMEPREASTFPIPEHGFTCFHCGETFTTRGSARDHFGFDPSSEPGCRIKLGAERGLIMALRKAEARAKKAEVEIERCREVLGQIAGKNNLFGVPDEDVESATCNALYECELLARAASQSIDELLSRQALDQGAEG